MDVVLTTVYHHNKQHVADERNWALALLRPICQVLVDGITNVIS